LPKQRFCLLARWMRWRANYPVVLTAHFPENSGAVTVRYASANNLSVIGAAKEDKDRISEILQETWESADDWFITD
jgi:DinI-like family.